MPHLLLTQGFWSLKKLNYFSWPHFVKCSRQNSNPDVTAPPIFCPLSCAVYLLQDFLFVEACLAVLRIFIPLLSLSIIFKIRQNFYKIIMRNRIYTKQISSNYVLRCGVLFFSVCFCALLTGSPPPLLPHLSKFLSYPMCPQKLGYYYISDANRMSVPKDEILKLFSGTMILKINFLMQEAGVWKKSVL